MLKRWNAKRHQQQLMLQWLSLLFVIISTVAVRVESLVPMSRSGNKCCTLPKSCRPVLSVLHNRFRDDDGDHDIEWDRSGILTTTTTTTTSTSTSTSRRHFLTRRRACFMAVAFTVTSLSFISQPQPSWALKQKNEQLCGTGFFTNYLEYKCTEIGDISDEGQRTTFSASEEEAADSLLSKFNLQLTMDDGYDNNDADHSNDRTVEKGSVSKGKTGDNK